MKTIISLVKVFFLSFVVSAAPLSCFGGRILSPENEAVEFTTDSGQAALSAVKIDNYTTHAVFFTLESPQKCIRLTIAASYRAMTYAEQPPPASVYFIVEQSFDISSFGTGLRSMYVNKGQNYSTSMWEPQESLEICGADVSAERPYRIRFTTFSSRPALFTIKLYGDSGAKFYAAEEEVKK